MEGKREEVTGCAVRANIMVSGIDLAGAPRDHSNAHT